MKKLTSSQVAQHLWERDGKPDGHELGEANRGTYKREAVAVLKAIQALGFRVVDREAAAQVARMKLIK